MKTPILMLALVCMAGLAPLADAKPRALERPPELSGQATAVSREVLITVQLVAITDVTDGARTARQDSTLSVRQLISLRSHYAGSMKDTERRSHAPLVCWGTRRELSECGPEQRFTGSLRVPAQRTQTAIFRYDQRRWQAGDALTVHTQHAALSATNREARLQHLNEPVMKAIALRQVLESARQGQASTQVITLPVGDRLLEFTYRVRATDAR